MASLAQQRPSGALQDRLSALYTNHSMTSNAHSITTTAVPVDVLAAVLDTVPAGVGSQWATADAVYVPRSTLQALSLKEGSWVLLAHHISSSSRQQRAVRAQVVSPQGAWCPAAAGSTSSPDAVAVGISPLLAHNLGLLHQLSAFSGDAAAAKGCCSNSQQQQDAGYLLQLQPVQQHQQQHQQHQQHQQQQQQQQVAQSVTICKVGQPLVSPVAGVPAPASTSSSSSVPPSGTQEASAAADGQPLVGHSSSSGQQQQGSSVGSSADPEGDGEELLQLLQAHFTQHTR